MMKYLIIIFFLFSGFVVQSQQRFPSGFPTQANMGWNKWGYSMTDSGLIVANRDTNWLAKYSGTVVFKPSNKKFYWFDSTNLTWNLLNNTIDTTSLSNRINLKLNITDTTGKWWGVGNRWVDTVYRINDSTVGYTINGGAQQTFEIKGGVSGGGGGSGTVTSVGLSLPSAFSVTPSTITTSGTFAVTGAGTTSQYIRGNGTLATTDTGMIPNFYLKVRGVLTGTSPITFNQTTGAIGINNANTSGTKGAASFTSAFSDNGSGLIDLAGLVSAGSCTGCNLNIDAKGRITGYTDGAGGATNNVNIGAGFRPVNAITQEMRTYFAGFGQQLDSVANANGLTWSADTTRITGLPTYFYVDSLHNTIGTITADNGLTKTGSNIQLGGTLTQSTTISTTASYFLNVTGSNVGQSLKGTNTSTGTGIMGQSTSGSGVYGLSSSLNGVLGVSTSGTGLVGESTSGEALNVYVLPSSTNTLVTVGRMQRFSSGTAANGIGGSFDFYTQSSGGSAQRSNRIGSSWSNATTASRTSILEFYGVNSATEARKAALAGTGQWIWDGYPALTAQIDTTTYKPVAIDGSGNVVKMAGWAAAGGGGATLNNIGSGYRWVATSGGNIKTVFASNTILWDSTSNSNALTAKADTSVLATQYDLTQLSTPTWPQTLAAGRTFAADDSAIITNKVFKFKGGTLETDSLTVNYIIDLPYTRSADTGVVYVNGIRFMHNYQDRAGQTDGQNTFLGIEAGNFTMGPAGGAVQLGGRNVGIGYKSLQSNTTGWQNTGVGHISLQKNTTGIYNTAVGAYAMVETTTGSNNTGIGSDALWLNTTGNDNAGVGTYILQQNTTGSENTAFGSNTMMQNLTGSSNTAIGKDALKYNQVYSFNTAVGYKSMEHADINNTTAIGARSLEVNIAPGNTAVGTFASQNNTTGANNTVVGYASRANATTGSDNTGVGANSLQFLTTGDGNTVLGQKTADSTTTGNDNIFIGNNAGDNNVTGSRHIVISTDGKVPAGASDGSLNIQNIIFGTENTATGYDVSTGRIGIRTTTPPFAFYVNGSVGANKDSIDLQTTAATRQMLVIDTTNGKFQRMDIPSGGSGITTLNTLTASTQTFATGTTGSDFNISSSTSTHTFNIPSASTSNRGVVTTTSQTFGGVKTFNDGVYITNSASTGRLRLYGNMSGSSGPSTTGSGLQLEGFTYTDNAAAGTQSGLQAIHLIGQPTITSGNAITYSGDAVTLRINGAPSAAGSMTLSHPWTVYANDISQFGGVAYQLNEQSGDVTIGATSNNIYTGAGGNTWTLSSLATHPGKMLYIKNAGGGNLTVQRGGSDNIYDTSSVTSITIAAGGGRIFIAGTSFWYVL